MNKKTKTNLLIILACASLVFMFAFLTLHNIQVQKKANQSLLRLGELLNIDDDIGSLSDFIDENDNLNVKNLKTHAVGYKLHMICTPNEFGSMNWCLIVLLRKDLANQYKVAGIGFRVEDTIKTKPSTAPPDRISEKASEFWEQLTSG